jgi:hypothetical protein
VSWSTSASGPSGGVGFRYQPRSRLHGGTVGQVCQGDHGDSGSLRPDPLRLVRGAAGRLRPKTVTAYVALRDAGADPLARPRRHRGIDPFLAKLEELVDRSAGKIRPDVAHDRLVAMGFAGSDRTTRRTVAELKAAWRAGHGRVFRPWVPEPGMWLQFDWATAPGSAGGGRACSARGWPGRATGW